jgi:hypothetical protein
MDFSMSKTLVESAFFTGLMVLSFEIILHRQFPSIPHVLFDFQGSVVGPQRLDIMVFYMSRRLAESALMIGLMVLSIASNSHRHRSGNSPLQTPHPSNFKDASSDLRGLKQWCSICLKDWLKVPY